MPKITDNAHCLFNGEADRYRCAVVRRHAIYLIARKGCAVLRALGRAEGDFRGRPVPSSRGCHHGGRRLRSWAARVTVTSTDDPVRVYRQFTIVDAISGRADSSAPGPIGRVLSPLLGGSTPAKPGLLCLTVPSGSVPRSCSLSPRPRLGPPPSCTQWLRPSRLTHRFQDLLLEGMGGLRREQEGLVDGRNKPPAAHGHRRDGA
jgi:hypothetical protein